MAELQDSISEVSIRGVVSRTPVKNGSADADWNCQSWVADALTRMVNDGYLNTSQRESAVDQMIDVCLEALGMNDAILHLAARHIVSRLGCL